jgi:cytoskeleton protein RodZ
MKEIGLKLKEKREENGVTIEEAAEDMKMRPSQIESLENGNREDFKDVGMLKYFIRDYAKYLGLDGEKLVDEFNEYLFDFTSKIPVGDIEAAKGKTNKNDKVSSPYTNVPNGNKSMKIFGICVIVIAILAIVGYLIFSGIKHDDFQDDDRTYIVRR